MAEKEVSLGIFDEMCLTGMAQDERTKTLANMRPHQLADALVSVLKRGTDHEALKDDLCLFLGIWGRARKEEGALELRRKLGRYILAEERSLAAVRESQERLEALRKQVPPEYLEAVLEDNESQDS